MYSAKSLKPVPAKPVCSTEMYLIIQICQHHSNAEYPVVSQFTDTYYTIETSSQTMADHYEQCDSFNDKKQRLMINTL